MKLRSVTPLSFSSVRITATHLALPPGSCLGQSDDPHISSSSAHWCSNMFRVLVFQQLCKTKGFVKGPGEIQRGTLGLFSVICVYHCTCAQSSTPVASFSLPQPVALGDNCQDLGSAEGRQEGSRLSLTRFLIY